MIAELSELSLSDRARESANPTMPLPRLDLPLIRSRWVDQFGRELTDLVDPPIAGVPVSLRDRFDLEIARTTTSTTGSYRFEDITRDDYTVVFTVSPSGGGSGGGGGSGPMGSAGDRRPATYWPGDSVVPTPVHTWLPTVLTGSTGFSLEGTLS